MCLQVKRRHSRAGCHATGFACAARCTASEQVSIVSRSRCHIPWRVLQGAHVWWTSVTNPALWGGQISPVRARPGADTDATTAAAPGQVMTSVLAWLAPNCSRRAGKCAKPVCPQRTSGAEMPMRGALLAMQGPSREDGGGLVELQREQPSRQQGWRSLLRLLHTCLCCPAVCLQGAGRPGAASARAGRGD